MSSRIANPTTIVRTSASGVVTRSTSIGAVRHPQATPAAFADKTGAQAARIVQALQGVIETVADILQSKHDKNAVVFKDIAFGAGTQVQIAHGLRRAFVGWRIERPRGSATFNPIEQTTTMAADTWLVLQSAASGTADVVVY